ncbi:MFS general substrate transporter [Roridomyces roridus]|uniref:MFS general substrate transporter n=1 Tax=Roridomyces roridus TaxID=1738132 RepID=A0AAD7CE23_9AGAR|nr:MFS general substrate transporter [Roridomyces roridus]
MCMRNSGSTASSYQPQISFQMSQETLEAKSNITVDVVSVSENDASESSLPPVDHGFHAYAYLASAWLVELLVWSYPFSYGVFLDYYKTHIFPTAPTSILALVGSMSTGIIYLSSWLVLPVISRFPALKKPLMALGVVFCVAGLVGAAFATEPWQLVLTQGVIYAVGGSFLYFPTMTWLFEWFSTRKGLANGIIFSGTGVGGVAVPFIVEGLLHRYGCRTTLLSMAIAFAVLIIPAFPYMKPRLPVSKSTTRSLEFNSFMRSPVFWILFAANLIQGLPTYIPVLYMPTFAADLGLSDNTGSLSLALVNGASVFGLVLLGWLSDRFDLRIAMLVSSLGSSLAVLLLWGFSSGEPLFLVFSFVYGVIGPSWSALWPRFIASIVGDDPHMSSIVLTVFIGGRGVGNVASGPVASAILRNWPLTGKAAFAYGLKGYGPLVLFTGLTLLLSAAGVGYKRFQKRGNSHSV